MERTWYSGYNLGSGKHTVHLLWRSTSIIPIRIVVIYMTDTSLLYPYSLSNQNQTDPIIYYLFLVDLEGVEPSSLILSWYYQQVVLCGFTRTRTWISWLTVNRNDLYTMNPIFQRTNIIYENYFFQKIIILSGM